LFVEERLARAAMKESATAVANTASAGLAKDKRLQSAARVARAKMPARAKAL